MDMSVKLNLSYPAVAVQDSSVAKAVPPAPSATQAEPEKAKEPKREELVRAVKDIQEFVQAAQRQLDFSIDDSTGKIVVKVIATDSGEVIRQLPSEAALKLAQSLTDANSLLFEAQA